MESTQGGGQVTGCLERCLGAAFDGLAQRDEDVQVDDRRDRLADRGWDELVGLTAGRPGGEEPVVLVVGVRGAQVDDLDGAGEVAAGGRGLARPAGERAVWRQVRAEDEQEVSSPRASICSISVRCPVTVKGRCPCSSTCASLVDTVRNSGVCQGGYARRRG
ncbi:MAG: hypothetical protein BGO37_12790 [Cellulomonas sp. 73-92]|nr:MAG: hypothetical protein BGO37_12790 [Cellulomonas sp. 73-92]